MVPHSNGEAELAAPAAAFTEVAIAEENTPSEVIIEAKCGGANFNRLSVAEGAKVAHVLQDAYNHAHSQSGNDDSELSSIRSRYDADFLQTDSLTWGSFSWSGYYGCNLCGNGDRDLTVGGSAGNAWEKEFEAGLASSGMEAFKHIKRCDITMRPSSHYVEKPNVDISVKCRGGPNFDRLSTSQATFVSHKLQSAYNEVHGEAADDDSDLNQVFYHAAKAVSSSKYLERSWGGWSGGFGCELCSENVDDIAASILAVGGTGASLEAWESEFVAALVESVDADFQKVKSCDIKMVPHSNGEAELSSAKGQAEVEMDVVVGESTKCGLRACADE